MALINDYDYFNDVNYSDYRELICYERPISVLLHYQYNIDFTRAFLYDRFNFEWNGTELINNSNSLNDFYNDKKLVTYEACEIKDIIEFKEFLNNKLKNDNQSLLLPYFSMFGDVKISSTVMVEKRDNVYVSTSLRGDNFFIRKEMNIDDFFSTLYLENNQVEYWNFNIQKSFIEQNSLKLQKAIEHYEIINKFKQEVASFKMNPNNLKGANGLLYAFEDLKKNYNYWNQLVADGLSNALMVKFFWPIQFYYKPFLVFLNFMDRNGLLGLFQTDQEKLSKLEALVRDIDKKTVALNNLALLFGKRPSERRFLEFENVFREILIHYREIEEIL